MSLNPSELIQGSAEWLAFRQGKIGSSHAAIIMGVSKYMTPLELYEEMMGLREPQQTTYPMLRGTQLEPKARAWYVKSTGIEMFPTVKLHKDYDFIHSSMDGISFSGKVGLEIKSPMNGSAKVAEVIHHGIPDDYFAQIQHHIMVAELECMDLVIWDDSEEVGCVFPVERDPEYIKRLLAAELNFYDCIKNGTPPEPTRKASKFRAATEYLTVEDLVEPLRESNERLKQEQEMNGSLKERLRQLCGESNVTVENMVVKFSKQRGTVDYKSIPELEGVDLDQYRKSDVVKMTVDFV